MYLVFSQLKFHICARSDLAFIEPMHRNKLNITYLRTILMVHCKAVFITFFIM